MPETWKLCSVCKTPILQGGRWFRCSVSTCNTIKLQLAFCSMTCWDAHVPTMNHRSGVWAVEEQAPDPTRRIVRSSVAPPEPQEVLIIASRLKDFVKEKADFNTSADVMDALSAIVRDATLEAIAHARLEGRRTVMARDFTR